MLKNYVIYINMQAIFCIDLNIVKYHCIHKVSRLKAVVDLNCFINLYYLGKHLSAQQM